jgi:hypothetical protein
VEASLCALKAKRTEFGTARNGSVEGLGGKERFGFKKIEVIRVGAEFTEKRLANPMQIGELRQVEVPDPIRSAVDTLQVIAQRLVIVKPLQTNGFRLSLYAEAKPALTSIMGASSSSSNSS